MGRLLDLSLIGLFLVTQPATAVVLEIPLPGLVGAYSGTRTEVISLSQTPTEIRGATILIRGSTVVGQVYCGGDQLNPWRIGLEAYLEDPATGDHWTAFGIMPTVTGPFGWEAPFESAPTYPPATWTLLMDGEAEIRLEGVPASSVCSPASAPPTAQVEAAIFYFDADFAVPANAGTWGRIRALYR